jgi:hypothetical protein
MVLHVSVLQIMSLDASGRHVAGSHLAKPGRLGEPAAGPTYNTLSLLQLINSALSAAQVEQVFRNILGGKCLAELASQHGCLSACF